MESQSSTAYYLLASRCLETAQKARVPEIQQAYLDLMKQCIELAERTTMQLDQDAAHPTSLILGQSTGGDTQMRTARPARQLEGQGRRRPNS
jgi:hypothetical protein